MSQENKEYNNVYLARIVSFSKESLLFNASDIQMPFETEEFCLVLALGNWAYNLDKQERYHIIDMDNGFINYEELISLEADIKYAYELYEFKDIWENFRTVLGIDSDISRYLDPRINMAQEYHDELNACKVYKIDFKKVVSFTDYKQKLDDKNKGND